MLRQPGKVEEFVDNKVTDKVSVSLAFGAGSGASSGGPHRTRTRARGLSCVAQQSLRSKMNWGLLTLAAVAAGWPGGSLGHAAAYQDDGHEPHHRRQWLAQLGYKSEGALLTGAKCAPPLSACGKQA